MNAVEVKHLTEEQLIAYATNSLDSLKANGVGSHLLECANCRNLLPAPTPQQFLSALFSEPDEDHQNSPQALFSKRSMISVIFSPFRDRQSLAWSAGALILATGFSFLFWETAVNKPNSITELTKSGSTEANLSSIPVDENSSNSMTEEVVNTQDEKKPFLVEIPSKKFNKSPFPATDKRKELEKLKEYELAKLIEKTPAAVLSLRPNERSVLRKNPDNFEAEKTFQLINPVGETVTETAPEFHWEKAANAESYKITIFDADFNEVLTAEVSDNKFKPDQSLKPGAKYLWRVAAQTEGGEIIAPHLPQPPAIFRIAPKTVESRIESFNKKKDEQFKLALFYAREGMLDLARCTLKRILMKNSEHRAAKRLLIEVEQWQKENKTGVQRCGAKAFSSEKANYK